MIFRAFIRVCLPALALSAACAQVIAPSAPGSSPSPAGPAVSAIAIAYVDSGPVLNAVVIGQDGALSVVAGSPYAAAGSTAVDRVHGFLYRASAAAVRGYRIDRRTGGLSEMAGSPFGGFGFEGLAVAQVDPAGRLLYVAGGVQTCRGGIDFVPCPGRLRSYRIDPATGVLTEGPGSPFMTGVYPRRILADQAGRRVLVVNHGYSGHYGDVPTTVSAFDVDASTGVLQERSGSPFTVSPSQYAAAAVSTDGDGLIVGASGYYESGVGTYAVPPSGPIQLRGFQPVAGRPWWASLQLAPSGRFALGTFFNGGGAVGHGVLPFALDPGTGRVRAGRPEATAIDPGPLLIDPSGRLAFVLPLDETLAPETLHVFKLDPTTGALEAAAGSPFALPLPVADYGRLFLDPSARFVYVAGLGTIVGFALDAATGVLAPLPGSPFTVPFSPSTADVVIVPAS